MERNAAEIHRIENRGSWVRESGSVDINMVLEELNESEITIYTLFELSIISELEASQLLQIVSENTIALHNFIRMIHAKQEITNHDVYMTFLDTYKANLAGTVHPLYYPFHMEEYPSSQITDSLLNLEKEGVINRVEYILLYKRCMMNSPALRHCYSVFTKNKNEQAYTKNIRLCLSIVNTISPSSTMMDDSHASILEEIIIKKHLPGHELAWLLNEYESGSELIRNALNVCKQTGDIGGFLSFIPSVMQMYTAYQEELEAKQFLTLLLDEMISNNSIEESDAIVLSMLIKESNEMLMDVYKVYKSSDDFEGLLAALIYIAQSLQNGMDTLDEEEDEAEVIEEMDEELSLPSLEEALNVIQDVANELPPALVNDLQQRVYEGNGVLLSTVWNVNLD